MCWVMPPASPAATLVERMASSSEVLPWSTWPITVTTGARGASVAGSSATSNTPSSTSASATRLTVWPSSSAISWAVSASITSLICRHLALLHQQPDDVDGAFRHAVGEFLDGDRFRDRHFAEIFSFGSLLSSLTWRRLRRRNEASDRSRTSSAVNAVTRVRRPRGFSVGLRCARRALRRRARRVDAAGTAPERAGPFLFFGLEHGTRARRPRRQPRRHRRRTASSRPRRPFAWFLRRACGDLLPRACGLRPLRARPSRSPRAWRDGALPLRRSCALRLRAAARRRARGRGGCAPRRSSVRSTTPDGFGAGACREQGPPRAPRPWRSRPSARASAGAAARLAAGRAPAGFGALLSAPGLRRFLTSTTTCLLRPWLKLWRTTPVSVRGLSDSVDLPTLSVLPSGVLVSAIQVPVRLVSFAAVPPLSPGLPVRKRSSAVKTRQKRVACRPGKQGCMYHI